MLNNADVALKLEDDNAHQNAKHFADIIVRPVQWERSVPAGGREPRRLRIVPTNGASAQRDTALAAIRSLAHG